MTNPDLFYIILSEVREMTDKKRFGSFIKQKRLEKGFSQKELADLLYVTESAVSKWERGVSYPDITLVSVICKTLDINEHELITSSEDTEFRRLKCESKKYRTIRDIFFYSYVGGCLTALLVCFIVSLSIAGELSWFFIVFASLLVACSFVPVGFRFINNHKLLYYVATTYFSLVILFLTCAAYIDNWSWIGITSVAVLLGYAVVFLPAIIRKYVSNAFIRNNIPLVTVAASWILTVILLLTIRITYEYEVIGSIIITTYCFIPAFVIARLVVLKTINKLAKAGLIALSLIPYYGISFIAGNLFNYDYRPDYAINFTDWRNCVNGNVYFLQVAVCFLVGVIWLVLGWKQARKRK